MACCNHPGQACGTSKLSSPNLPLNSVRGKCHLTCFRLRACSPSTEIPVWEPNRPHVMGFGGGSAGRRVGLGEAVKAGPPRWVGAPGRRGPGWRSLSSWSEVAAGGQSPARQEEGLTGIRICRHLDLGLPSLWSCEKSLSRA